jgi:hypothetical protein
MVFVCLRMYCFHASDPASRPPPVSFSPPKAPPISAPECTYVDIGYTAIGACCRKKFFRFNKIFGKNS